MTAGTDFSVSIQAAAPNITSQVFGSGLIGLREGLEATILVSILVAFLVKTGHRGQLPAVRLGIAAAVAVPVVVTTALALTAKTLTFTAQEVLGGGL